MRFSPHTLPVKSSTGRQGITSRWLLIFTLLCITIVVVSTGAKRILSRESKELSADVTGVDQVDPESSEASDKKFVVSIRQPNGPPRVATGMSDLQGNPVTVACSTCHTTRPANHQNTSTKDLDEFHAGMTFSHGSVSCLSCHNTENYDSLKLADDSRVEFTDVMMLCAQCHGPQMTAYQHGAHGGMNGHWDLTRGPQVKNNCVDCHNPHAPQFPKMQPTFKPQDRFLDGPEQNH